MVKQPQTSPDGRARARHSAVLLDAAIALLAIGLFWPLTRYFFAQDDFTLIETAARGFRGAVGEFFAGDPGQFRPLTKGLYFMAAHAAFGMNPVLYHVVSLLLHAANAVLLGAVLRRMGITAATSRFVAAAFAVSMANMEAVAWIVCVQQLCGGLCFGAALLFGIDAVEGRGRHRWPAATLAFVLALASYEQTMVAPLVLMLWVAMRHGWSEALRATRAGGGWLFAVLAAYVVFMLVWKGIPDSGPYAMSAGRNVVENLAAYSGLVFSVGQVLPEYGLPTGFTASHAVWVLVALVLLMRRRSAELGFGVAGFIGLLLPVLFTSEHTHSFHLYVPALAAWFTAAAAIDALRARGAAQRGRWLDAGLAAAAAACVVGAFMALHRNTGVHPEDEFPLPRSFVIRRAVIAERLWTCIRAKANPRNESGRLILVYRHPEYRGNWLNVHAALGQGSAVRLALERPNLDVIFVPPAEMPADVNREMEALYYTELGECRTVDEIRSQ